MCFHSKQSQDATTLRHRFKADGLNPLQWDWQGVYNGFAHPYTPIITQDQPQHIIPAYWGLIPHWANFQQFKANTLNAKIETLAEKPSFLPYMKNRCWVIIDGFYEWQWLDAQGRRKQKYLITRPDTEAFALAGLYSDIIIPESGELIRTYTIVTTGANELMSEIHNTKKRMPVILTKANERAWLEGQDIQHFKTCTVELVAEKMVIE